MDFLANDNVKTGFFDNTVTDTRDFSDRAAALKLSVEDFDGMTLKDRANLLQSQPDVYEKLQENSLKKIQAMMKKWGC